LDFGLDLNRNGQLDDSEILQTKYVCSGLTSLARTRVEPSGIECQFGGIRFETGFDLDNDGLLDDSEVRGSASYLCNASQPAWDPRVSMVSASWKEACAVRLDGTLQCWGEISTPPSGKFVSVDTAEKYGCAIREDGALACWGETAPQAGGNRALPTGRFTKLSVAGWADARYGCAIALDGTVACWGSNADGKATPPPGEFTDIAAGDYHACGLRKDRTIQCWGNNSEHQTEAPLGEYHSVTAGSRHTCALSSENFAICWGNPSEGESVFTESFKEIVAGTGANCGVTDTDSLYCWGDRRPTDPHLWATERLTKLAMGYDFLCGLRADGSAACFGRVIR
jgi:hypothetical protein